ncbi:MAG: MFS transporter [Actinobacteria bacterium]|nr:MAG: MFS transporter [Actinomycetota bacterium]
MSEPVRLGLRANAHQFALLVGLNALVGGMVGLERSVLPLVGKQDFGLRSSSAILAFVVAFGAAKALSNLAAGDLAERIGRKRLLVIGWLVALPVPLLIGLAPTWWYIVAANLLLGVSQGFTWSMTVVMKIDLAGSRRRGLALGLNEAAGLLATVGLLVSFFAVRDTGAHVAHEQLAHGDSTGRRKGLRETFAQASWRDPVLRACSQAGLVNNLNDALAWGLAPLYLAAHGASVQEIAIVAAAYPLVWGAGQLATGWLSDHTGRKPLITAGMLIQAGALGLLVAGGGAFAASLVAALLLGLGTALVYPTLIAAVSDATQPRERARTVGVYRFWRDFGFVAGALIAGFAADATSPKAAIATVAALTAASGFIVAATRWHSLPVVLVAFLVATAAQQQGKEVVVWATKDAVRLGLTGGLQGVVCKGCPPLEQLWEQFTDAGGELWLCPICLTARDLGDAETVTNTKVAGATPMWEWAGSDATIFSY